MRRICLAMLALSTLLCTNLPARADAEYDQFDFWLGEWTVTNRHLQNGAWSETGTAHAHIRPVLGGRAVLEEWTGLTGPMASVRGFSLRWYDKQLKRWVVLLNWPGGANPNPTFGRMEGAFDEQGVCHLYPPSLFTGPASERSGDATRYTFSDAMPDSCRWSMSTPDANGTYTTTWTMDFARKADPLPDNAPLDQAAVPPNPACAGQGARGLDTFLGVWQGHADLPGDATERAARVTISSAVGGCLTFVSIAFADDDEAMHEQYFMVLAYNTQQHLWTARVLNRNLKLASLTGRRIGENLRLSGSGRDGTMHMLRFDGRVLTIRGKAGRDMLYEAALTRSE